MFEAQQLVVQYHPTKQPTKLLKNGPLVELFRWKFSFNAQRLLIQSAILTKFATECASALFNDLEL